MSVLTTYRRLLRNRAMTRLLVGEFVSSVGDWLYLVALLVVVYQESRSAVALGIIGAARVLPYILLSVPAGVVADRFDRRMILITTDIARGVVMVALGLVVLLGGPLPVFVGLSILAACFSTFFGPAIGSLVPSLVTDESELGPANSAWATLDNLATVVGPGVAGLLIAAGGLPLAFFINAATFAVIASVLARLPKPSRAVKDATATAEDALEAPARAASTPLRHVMQPLAGLALIIVVAAFVFGGLSIVTVVIAADVLGDAEGTTGFLNGALGLGGLLGALLSGVLVVGRRLLLPLLGGGLLLGVCLMLLGQVDSLIPVLVLMTLASSGSLLQEVVSTTIFQRTVPDAVRGRALGILTTVGISAYAGGALVAPIAAGRLGLALTLFALGSLLAAATVAGVALLGRTASDRVALDAAQIRLLHVPVFSGLPPARLEAAAGRAVVREVAPGEVVIRQAEAPDRFYVILSGRFRVTQEAPGDPQPRLLRVMGPDEVFGEIGLLSAVPRTATVTAEDAGSLLALDGPTFLELVASGPGLTSSLLDLHRGMPVVSA
ncbi:MAG: MFS transporter [Candidatus Limnocylindria bacterium]